MTPAEQEGKLMIEFLRRIADHMPPRWGRWQARAWSAANWAEGYRWGPVQRWRCCGHTTPYHSRGCWRLGSER